MSKSYLPGRNAELVTWLNNFSTKMQTQYGSVFGFTAAELTSIKNDAANVEYAHIGNENRKTGAAAGVAFLRTLRSSATQTSMGQYPALPVQGTPPPAVSSGVLNRIANYVQRIKHHSNYTDAIGQDLGIIAPSSSFNPATMQPELIIKMSAGYPYLKWKRGEADGLHLYVDRRDGNGFVLLAKQIKPEYMDVSPLPQGAVTATWDYKARYIINDDEIGLFSGVVSVNVVRV